MKPTPPGTVRTLKTLARLAMRRMWNRLAAGFFRKKRKSADKTQRTATPRKRRRNLVFALLIVLLYAFMIANIAAQMLGRFADALDTRPAQEDTRIPVDWTTYGEIEMTRRQLDRAEGNPSTPTETGFTDPTSEKDHWLASLRSTFAQDARFDGMTDEDAEAHADHMMQVFNEKGPDGFRQKSLGRYQSPFGHMWPSEGHRVAMVGTLALVMLLIFLMLLLLGFGGRDQDIGKVEWSLEWLFTFPVSTRVLFLGRLLEYTVTNLFGWMLCVPFFLMVFWSAGYTGWVVLLAPACALYVILIVSSLRIVGETWMRKTFAPNRLRSVQAVCGVLWILAFAALMFVAYMREVPDWMTETIPRLGAGFAWNPASLPVALCLDGEAPALATVLMLLLLFLVPVAAVRLCAWLVRGGLVVAATSYQGTRTRAARPARTGFFKGIVGKDVKLLLRDRNFLIQTLVLPLAVVAMQLLINPHMFEAVSSNLSHASVFAFAVGAYVLIFGAFRVLIAEGGALWLLYTFPQRIEDVMRRKVLLWASLASVYTVTILVAACWLTPAAGAAVIPNAVMAVVGVFIYAYIAAGLGILGTDVLQTETQHKVRAENSLIYMLLAGMYAHGLYAPSLWSKIAQVTLCALVAYAIWQKVRDHAPYLLDPTQMPPPRIALSDGLIAALAFFTIHGVVVLIGMTSELGTLGSQLAVGYVIAGATVSVAMTLHFARRKVPRLAETLGLRRALPAEPGRGKSTLIGVGLGAAAGVAALGYLGLAEFIEPLRVMKGETRVLDLGVVWSVVLVILAAPFFEEFIFRGLVFRGLRRSLPLGWALLASAGIFAVVHPPISVVPVFGLGLAAAYAFEKTRLLIVPVLTHMTYNLIVLLFSAGI